ncbi:hypothetical protein Hanom_Chr01g00072901 [Helianthus anomalus]
MTYIVKCLLSLTTMTMEPSSKDQWTSNRVPLFPTQNKNPPNQKLIECQFFLLKYKIKTLKKKSYFINHSCVINLGTTRLTV